MTSSLASVVPSSGHHQTGVLIGEPALEQLLEDPLGPAVVGRVGRIDLARPVIGEAERLQLGAEAFDVALRRLARVAAVTDGVLFRRQAEGVPADRVQHIAAAHALVTR